MRAALISALVLGACVSAPGEPAVDASAVVAAERAFAADGLAHGWAGAFRRAAAPEALMLTPDPQNAHEFLAGVEGEGEPILDWRPAFAGVARSGDLGFTTGPYMRRGRDGIAGHYFTVWRRQADGTWKWIFDAGTAVADPGPPVAADAEIPLLAPGVASPGAAAALRAVAVLEENLDARSAPLSPEARVNRAGQPAGVGAAAGEALFAADGAIAYTPLRREASEAGDLVFSFGEARDTHEGAERLRYYARIWRLEPVGWRIVFDEIVPRRG